MERIIFFVFIFFKLPRQLLQTTESKVKLEMKYLTASGLKIQLRNLIKVE